MRVGRGVEIRVRVRAREEAGVRGGVLRKQKHSCDLISVARQDFCGFLGRWILLASPLYEIKPLTAQQDISISQT